MHELDVSVSVGLDEIKSAQLFEEAHRLLAQRANSVAVKRRQLVGPFLSGRLNQSNLKILESFVLACEKVQVNRLILK